MKTTYAIATAILGTSLFIASAANAQGASDTGEKPSKAIPAVTRAVELTIASGYTQGFGDVGKNQLKLTDVSTAGGVVELGAGYRIIPELTLGVYGTGSMFGRGSAADASANIYSATAGIEASWHFLPAMTVDPWVALGTGWRGYWTVADPGDTSQHGYEIAKLKVGVDYRLSEAVAISPVIGADMSMFLTQSPLGTDTYSNVTSPKVNTFVFGGIMGRFDIATGSEARAVAARW